MAKGKGDVTSSFHDENLIFTTLDLFVAGTETTLMTLTSFAFPEKVQAEIDRVLGQSQRPNTAARESTPYTNAVIHEVQRMGNIIPMNAPRQVAADTSLAGYHLPKVIRVLLAASDLQYAWHRKKRTLPFLSLWSASHRTRDLPYYTLEISASEGEFETT
uniref:Cytochrome P450 n=1 Tax=Sus scrofa TaxID=9823 RepID=A0A8D1KPV1_PIG